MILNVITPDNLAASCFKFNNSSSKIEVAISAAVGNKLVVSPTGLVANGTVVGLEKLTANQLNVSTDGVIVSSVPIISAVTAGIVDGKLTISVNGISNTAISLPIPVLTIDATPNTGTFSLDNGVATTLTFVRSVTTSTDGINKLVVTVNGIASSPLVLPAGTTTNLLNTSANTLTSTVNGIVATAATVTTNTLVVDANGGLVSTVNGLASATVPIPNFWKSTLGTAGLPSGVATDQTTAIQRNGSIGLNVAPLSTVDVGGSLGLNQVSTTAAVYALLDSDSVVHLTATTTQTVTLLAPTAITRRVITLVNSTSVAKATSLTYVSLANGATSTVIGANSSITLQSIGTAWRQISLSSPVVAYTAGVGIAVAGTVISNPNRRAINSTFANALLAASTISLGELNFRYDTAALAGNLAVASNTGAAVVIDGWYQQEISPTGTVYNNVNGGLTTTAVATAFTTIGTLGLGLSEVLFYYIATRTNNYTVRIQAFQGASFTMVVEKAI